MNEREKMERFARVRESIKANFVGYLSPKYTDAAFEILAIMDEYAPAAPSPLAPWEQELLDPPNSAEQTYSEWCAQNFHAYDWWDGRIQHKIKMIKALREAFPGTSLLDAKNAVEAFEASHREALNALRSKLTYGD